MKFIALAPSATGTSWIVGAETPVPPWVVVTTVSPETAVITGTITDPTFEDSYAIAITPDGTKAYVANFNTGSASGPGTVTVIAIDKSVSPETATVTGTVSGSFDNPIAIAITPDGTTAYVINSTGGTISIVNVATNTITGTVTGTFHDPDAIAIAPDGTTAYVANNLGNGSGGSGTGYISIITIDKNASPETAIVTGVITDSSFDHPALIAVTADGTKACVVNAETVSIINLTNNVVTLVNDSANTLNYNDLYGLALTPDSTTAYVTNTSTIAIIDIAKATVTGSISDARLNEPNGIAVTPDNSTAYTSNNGNNTVSIIYINVIIQAPGSMQLQSVVNDFLTWKDHINVISWTVPTSGLQVENYAIYRDAALTQLVVNQSASDELEYMDHNRQAGVTYSYYIVSIDQQGTVSAPISQTITTL